MMFSDRVRAFLVDIQQERRGHSIDAGQSPMRIRQSGWCFSEGDLRSGCRSGLIVLRIILDKKN
jgi:hypothetical protein